MKDKQLLNKISVITGAGDGMGRSIAKLFACEGAIVVINDINLDKAKETEKEIYEINKNYKNKVLVVKADITNSDEVASMVREVKQKFGTIDILVNNAGILFSTRIEYISEEEWDMVVNVNLKGVFLCSKAVIQIMKEKKYGKILNMSSSAGKTVSTIGGAHYTASKAGVLGLSRAMAKELAPFNINVNAICPGLVDTDMVRDTIPKGKIVQYAGSFPIGRLSTPEEVADLALFLVSEKSSYIIGASIDINGGDLMI